MSETWPFLFFGHGVVEPESVDKCEEVFLWFERAPTLSERKRIVATCPAPLASFQWGDRFVYFGSPGDSYDGLVAETYGSEAFRTLMAQVASEEVDLDEVDFDGIHDEIAAAVGPFAADLDRWVREVHAVVPILFFFGPNGADPDDPWNRWSEAHVSRAVEAVVAHGREHPWLARGEAAGDEIVEPTPEKGRPKAPKVDKWLVTSMPRSEVARFYGYIRDRVLRAGFEAADDEGKRAAIEAVYAGDGITGEVGPLSLEEHAVHSNGNLVAEYLGETKGAARWKKLGGLSPWVRLAYVASYAARKAQDLVKQPDPVGFVRDALAALPPERDGRGVVLRAANHLCDVSPAFSKPNKKHAALSASLLSTILDDRAPAEARQHAATFSEWAGDDVAALDIAKRALAVFPDHQAILSGAIATAGRLGDKALIVEWSKRLDAGPPDHDVVLNRTFALVKADRPAEALDILRDYLAKRGKPTASILTNYTYCLRYACPGPEKAAPDLDRLEQLLEAHPKLLREATLVENVVGAMNTNGRVRESIAWADRAVAAGLRWTPALLCGVTYSAFLTGDPAVAKEVADRADALTAAQPRLLEGMPWTLGNLAGMRGLTGELDAGFALLRTYATLLPPDRAEWERDYAPFRGDPRFEEILSGR